MSGFLSMIPHTLPAWLGAGAAAGGGFASIKWVFEFVGGRMDKRADRLDADTRFVIDQLRAELGRTNQRLDRVETELADCQHKHAEAEAKVMRLEARQQGYSEARDRAQTILAAERLADRGMIPPTRDNPDSA